MFRQSSQHSAFGTFPIFHASNRVRNTKIIFIFANNHLEFHFACLLWGFFFTLSFPSHILGRRFFFSVANIIHLNNVRLKQMKNSVSRLNLIQSSKFKIVSKTHIILNMRHQTVAKFILTAVYAIHTPNW